MLQFSMTERSCSYYQRTVFNCIVYVLVLLSLVQYCRRAYRRSRFPKCNFVGIDHAEMRESEIAHCPSDGANI